MRLPSICLDIYREVLGFGKESKSDAERQYTEIMMEFNHIIDPIIDPIIDSTSDPTIGPIIDPCMGSGAQPLSIRLL